MKKIDVFAPSVLKYNALMLYLLAFLTPFSLTVFFAGESLGLSIPAEPLLVLCCGLFFLYALQDRAYLKKVFIHPLSWLLLAYLIWVFISAVFSPLPVVALKSWITKIWFIVPCFYFALPVFEDRKRRERFLWAFLLALAIVCIYGLIVLMIKGYSYNQAFRISSPFFKEHTNYSAVVAFFMPIAGYFAFKKGDPSWRRILAGGIFVVFAFGLVFAVCRAAWISAFVAVAVYLLILLRIKIKWILSAIALVLLALFVFQKPITSFLENNTREKSDKFSDLIISSFNYTSSLSNLERLNRWKSGIKMFKERPLLGHGSGTYQFIYGPYQDPADITDASTMDGDRGNIDQEYLTPLVDCGIPAFILFLLWIFYIFKLCYQITRGPAPTADKKLTIAIFLSFITYFVHGFFNSFLEIDKSAVPFFAFMALLVAIKKQADGQAGEKVDDLVN